MWELQKFWKSLILQSLVRPFSIDGSLPPGLVLLLQESMSGEALTACFVCMSQAPDNVMQVRVHACAPSEDLKVVLGDLYGPYRSDGQDRKVAARPRRCEAQHRPRRRQRPHRRLQACRRAGHAAADHQAAEATICSQSIESLWQSAVEWMSASAAVTGWVRDQKDAYQR